LWIICLDEINNLKGVYMNIKVIGSVIRWVLVIIGSIGIFASDAGFVDALKKLQESIASGDILTIISSVVAVVTLGWSIWDKIKTQNKEEEAEATIKQLSNTVKAQSLMINNK